MSTKSWPTLYFHYFYRQ